LIACWFDFLYLRLRLSMQTWVTVQRNLMIVKQVVVFICCGAVTRSRFEDLVFGRLVGKIIIAK